MVVSAASCPSAEQREILEAEIQEVLAGEPDKAKFADLAQRLLELAL